MALRDRYGSDGILAEGPERYRTDEKVICEPWPATLAEIEATLGSISQSRRGLFEHLAGFMSWFDRAFAWDRRREVWVRGRFASTLAPQVDELDIVLQCSTAQLAPGDLWLLRTLTAGPIEVPPHRVALTPLRPDRGEYAFERDQEALRSRVRTLHSGSKEQIVAGWLRVAGEESHA